MSIYKKIIVMSIFSLAVTGCSNISNDINKEETPAVESPVVQDDEAEDSKLMNDEDLTEEVLEAEEEAGHTHDATHTHDAGYSELIHGGFSMKFQELMETIYSRVNYSMMGVAVEDIVPMDESVMTSVEEMMSNLNPIQDGEILKIVGRARELFDKTNDIIETKKYEMLWSLNEEGQDLYNVYYDWLIEVAANHNHDE